MPAQSAVSAVENDVDDDSDVYHDGAEDAAAYYTGKLTFFHDFPVNVWGADYVNVHIILNFYGKCSCITEYMPSQK